MRKTVETSKPFLSAHVPFDEDTWDKIKRLAEAEDRTIVATVRVLVREALATHERGGAR